MLKIIRMKNKLVIVIPILIDTNIDIYKIQDDILSQTDYSSTIKNNNLHIENVNSEDIDTIEKIVNNENVTIEVIPNDMF